MRLQSIIAIAALLFAAACASSSPSPSASAAPSATPAGAPAAPAARPLTANIVTTGATSTRLAGSVTLTPMDAGTYAVSMELRGGPSNRQLPWSIRPGSCGDVTPNSDIGGRALYSPIQTAADGQAHINTRIRVQLPAQQTLRVDVMASNNQRDIVIACGLLLVR